MKTLLSIAAWAVLCWTLIGSLYFWRSLFQHFRHQSGFLTEVVPFKIRTARSREILSYIAVSAHGYLTWPAQTVALIIERRRELFALFGTTRRVHNIRPASAQLSSFSRALAQQPRSFFSQSTATTTFVVLLVVVILRQAEPSMPLVIWLSATWLSLALLIALFTARRELLVATIRWGARSSLLNLAGLLALLGGAFPVATVVLGMLVQEQERSFTQLVTGLLETYSLNGVLWQGFGGALKEAWTDQGKLLQFVAGLGIYFAIGIEGIRSSMRATNDVDRKGSAQVHLFFGNAARARQILDTVGVDDTDTLFLRIVSLLLSDEPHRARELCIRKMDRELSQFPYSLELSANFFLLLVSHFWAISEFCRSQLRADLVTATATEDEFFLVLCNVVGSGSSQAVIEATAQAGVSKGYLFAQIFLPSFKRNGVGHQEIVAKALRAPIGTSGVSMFIRASILAGEPSDDAGQSPSEFLADLLSAIKHASPGGIAYLAACACALSIFKRATVTRNIALQDLIEQTDQALKEQTLLMPYGQVLLEPMRLAANPIASKFSGGP
jgi:hypothetical protein